MSGSSNLELEYRKIPSLQFLYEVNGNGTVIRNVKSKRHLKLFRTCHNSRTEYWCTQVNIKRHIRKVFVHRVVAECWLGKRPDGMQVDHIDRNSLNNDWHNLRYVSKSQQMLNRDYSAFIDVLLENLSTKNGGRMNPVRLISPTGTVTEYPTARRAAKFLAAFYNCGEKMFNDRFYHKRRHIYDFDVQYLSAETGHGNLCEGKEQSGSISWVPSTASMTESAPRKATA